MHGRGVCKGGVCAREGCVQGRDVCRGGVCAWKGCVHGGVCAGTVHTYVHTVVCSYVYVIVCVCALALSHTPPFASLQFEVLLDLCKQSLLLQTQGGRR